MEHDSGECHDMNCRAHGTMNRLYASLNQELEAALDECARLQRENRELKQHLKMYNEMAAARYGA